MLTMLRVIQSFRYFSSKEKFVTDLFLDTLKNQGPTAVNAKSEQHITLVKENDVLRKRRKVKHNVKKQYASKLVSASNNAFHQFPQLHGTLLKVLNKNYERVLPVQENVIPVALQKQNVVFQSETGSGKTLAFAVPVIDALFNNTVTERNPCVIIAPNWELADQIYKVFLQLLPKPSSVMVLKSNPGPKLIEKLLQGCPIMIMTPSSFNTSLKNGIINLFKIRILVMDEVDRLFEDDFRDQTEHLITFLKTVKQGSLQVLMSSATLSPDITEFLSSGIKDLQVISSGIVSPTSIKHNCIVVSPDRKTEAVLKILETQRKDDGSILKTILFVLTREMCQSLNEVLQGKGYFSTALHGDLNMKQRTAAFKDFLEDRYDVLVSTDIVARGVDVPNCESVIQVQPRVESNMFLHRAGRCGRAGRTGVNTVIASDGDEEDRQAVTEIRKSVDIEVVDGSSLLSVNPSGDTSLLDTFSSFPSDELSFTLEIDMVQDTAFYRDIFAELGLHPVTTTFDGRERLAKLWFGSPVEAWTAQSSFKNYIISENLPYHDARVFRYRQQSKKSIDWDGYFNDIRQRNNEYRMLKYKNFVKREMGQKRAYRKRKN